MREVTFTGKVFHSHFTQNKRYIVWQERGEKLNAEFQVVDDTGEPTWFKVREPKLSFVPSEWEHLIDTPKRKSRSHMATHAKNN